MASQYRRYFVRFEMVPHFHILNRLDKMFNRILFTQTTLQILLQVQSTLWNFRRTKYDKGWVASFRDEESIY